MGKSEIFEQVVEAVTTADLADLTEDAYLTISPDGQGGYQVVLEPAGWDGADTEVLVGFGRDPGADCIEAREAWMSRCLDRVFDWVEELAEIADEIEAAGRTQEQMVFAGAERAAA